ncbi:MAG: hypothetical protein AAB497_02525 [Patescibacteria group bacterium]
MVEKVFIRQMNCMGCGWMIVEVYSSREKAEQSVQDALDRTGGPSPDYQHKIAEYDVK